jgi:hypothetical protein
LLLCTAWMSICIRLGVLRFVDQNPEGVLCFTWTSALHCTAGTLSRRRTLSFFVKKRHSTKSFASQSGTEKEFGFFKLFQIYKFFSLSFFFFGIEKKYLFIKKSKNKKNVYSLCLFLHRDIWSPLIPSMLQSQSTLAFPLRESQVCMSVKKSMPRCTKKENRQ